MLPQRISAEDATCTSAIRSSLTWPINLHFGPQRRVHHFLEILNISQIMAGAIHGVLQAMDNLANAPVLVTARLLQPARPSHVTHSAADLTPPKVRKRRKRKLTLPLETPGTGVSGKAKLFSTTTQQRTFEQSQSPLFRLPAELREEIWKYVILGRRDNGAIDIVWRSTGSGRGRASAFKVDFNLDRDQWGIGVLGMLCSCRVM